VEVVPIELPAANRAFPVVEPRTAHCAKAVLQRFLRVAYWSACGGVSELNVQVGFVPTTLKA
jgi:hypothetical protein